MDILLSVIISVYNVETYLEECLEKLVPQLSDCCEVILVNDGSTDSSYDICKKYTNAQNVIVVSQKNAGLSAARNTGIRNAKGRFLFFLDADDYLANDAIEVVLSEISKYDISAAPDFCLIRSKSFQDGYTDYIDDQVDYNLISHNCPAELFLQLLKINDFWFAAWLVIINKTFLLENDLLFKEGIFHEDELWVPQVFAKAATCSVISQCLYCYRKNRQGSIINHKNSKKDFDKFIIIDELMNYKQYVDKKGKQILDDRCASLEFGLICQIYQYKNEECYSELYDQTKNRLAYLVHKKYFIIYIACKIIGIKNCSRLLCRILNI